MDLRFKQQNRARIYIKYVQNQLLEKINNSTEYKCNRSFCLLDHDSKLTTTKNKYLGENTHVGTIGYFVIRLDTTSSVCFPFKKKLLMKHKNLYEKTVYKIIAKHH